MANQVATDSHDLNSGCGRGIFMWNLVCFGGYFLDNARIYYIGEPSGVVADVVESEAGN